MSEKLLKNCNVLDVNGQKILEGRSILIDGNRIKKIGRVDEFSALEKELPRETIFEINGRMVMPGLIDAHVHHLSSLSCLLT